MGHARIDNVSRFFNQMVKRPDGATITEVVDEMARRGMAVSASEGKLTDRYVLALVTEALVSELLDRKCIEPVKLTAAQEPILRAWCAEDGAVFNWDAGDDGKGGEFGILDSIRFRALKKRLPVIERHES